MSVAMESHDFRQVIELIAYGFARSHVEPSIRVNDIGDVITNYLAQRPWSYLYNNNYCVVQQKKKKNSIFASPSVSYQFNQFRRRV